jgi:3-hydroxyisobutyrate dehydrogenase
MVATQDIIITSLPPGKPLVQVFTDPSTSILAAKISDGSRLVIDTSTLDVQSSLKIAKQVVGAGFGDFVDCPVSGGMEFARRGELSSMIGGSKELFDRVQPIVLAFSDRSHIYHCGPAGSGLAAKIINNYIASISYVALCEGTSESLPNLLPHSIVISADLTKE